jgi:hypothetical protein
VPVPPAEAVPAGIRSAEAKRSPARRGAMRARPRVGQELLVALVDRCDPVRVQWVAGPRCSPCRDGRLLWPAAGSAIGISTRSIGPNSRLPIFPHRLARRLRNRALAA